ncbi:MAG TPA: adenylosuccinate synthetase [Micromonosporaceae bacterium]
MSAIVIVDALWGDSGKGKTCAHLAQRLNADLAVRAGVGTNAGASMTLDDGTLVKARQFPTGWINAGTKVAVGSGVLVDPEIALAEIERFGLAGRAMIDGRCAIITEAHIEAERADPNLADKIGSTCTGNGQARADFILRRASQARDVTALSPYVGDVAREVNSVAANGTVIVEGSQGTMLSLAFSPDYPFTTSDNCTTAAAIDDVGLNWRLVTDVVMVVKAMPTRVGEGPLPYEMTHAEAVSRGIAEFGVNTCRPRRKAETVDLEMLRYAAMLNGPTQIALTFCDHYEPTTRGSRSTTAITPRLAELIRSVEEATGAPVTMLDTGPRLTDMIDLVSASA